MRIAGCGCALIDLIYNHVDFESDAMLPFRSRTAGDGGIDPGRLVFLQDFERFARVDYAEFIDRVLGGREPDGVNVGGPSIVALAIAAQLLLDQAVTVSFYGQLGEDSLARTIRDILRRTPLDLSHYGSATGMTPRTLVLSDPNYHDGHGERAFVNALGVAADYTPQMLPGDFFTADIALFGATGLTPALHESLGALVDRAHAEGAFVVVTTVFDFLNEQKHPDRPWPLVGEEDWAKIDLLVMDYDEALRISGAEDLDAACNFFASRPSAFIITQGPKPVTCQARGGRFAPLARTAMPVSQAVIEDAEGCRDGDTTGCGDNFAGGVLASVAGQMQAGRAPLDLLRAVAAGVCAGGRACYQLGGIALEREPGQCRREIDTLYGKYLEQLGGSLELPERIW